MTAQEMKEKLIELGHRKSDVVDNCEQWVRLGLTLDQVVQMEKERNDRVLNVLKHFGRIEKMCKPGEK